SRRRHTRCLSDWSSDVCSSDLKSRKTTVMRIRLCLQILALTFMFSFVSFAVAAQSRDHLTPQEIELVQESQVLDKRTEVFIKARSEERRVGKENRCREGGK